jgi:TFIIF-interacting CTD phosphatase-like protein
MMSSETTSHNSNSDEGPTLTDILLPGQEFVVDYWTVQSGSVVRLGETIAFACHKSKATDDHDTAANIAVKPENAPAHKRPNRRRRPQHTGVPSNVSTSSAPPSSFTATKTVLSLKERLASRLASKTNADPTSNDGSKAVVGTIPKSISVKTSTTGPLVVQAKTDKLSILAPASGILWANTANPKSNLNAANKRLVVGYIEQCLHPTILDGMCVVCGTAVPRKIGSIGDTSTVHGSQNDSLSQNIAGNNLSQVTVSGGITMTVSERESRQMAQRDSERLFRQKRLALVLDLDHTMVHATSDARARQYLADHQDVRTIRLPMLEGADPATSAGPQHASRLAQHYVKLRPHIKELLCGIESSYEVTVYTAGTRHYAEEITMLLCRSVVGSTRDWDEMGRLRYEVKMAQDEYSRHFDHLLIDNEKKRTIDQINSGVYNNNNSNDNSQTIEPAKKRKKISFGFREAGNEVTTQKSDHMTKERLEQMQAELRKAEDLEKMARDLRQKLFGSRVFSRTDVGDLGRDVKSLKRIFPCGGTMAAVVDDREDVWANAKDNSESTIKGEPPENLLLVRPYHWQPFVGFADINNAAGSDLSSTTSGFSSDPSIENDHQLLWTKDILERLHQRYYQPTQTENRLSVPEILREMRQSVLKGCTLVLSGLVPLYKQSCAPNAARLPIVRYAESLGAKVRRWRFVVI